jgi:hypothetical protein
MLLEIRGKQQISGFLHQAHLRFWDLQDLLVDGDVAAEWSFDYST